LSCNCIVLSCVRPILWLFRLISSLLLSSRLVSSRLDSSRLASSRLVSSSSRLVSSLALSLSEDVRLYVTSAPISIAAALLLVSPLGTTDGWKWSTAEGEHNSQVRALSFFVFGSKWRICSGHLLTHNTHSLYRIRFCFRRRNVW
jgi:hypothetical protein